MEVVEGPPLQRSEEEEKGPPSSPHPPLCLAAAYLVVDLLFLLRLTLISFPFPEEAVP